ncbi:MAG: hypothetical protein ABI594_02000 [Ginsengibacter sp.]
MMLSAKINGTETLKKSIGEEPLQIDINKSDYKGICSFDVIIDDKNVSAAYKRTIELTDTSGESLYTSDESGTPGVYKIDLSSICKKISSQTIIKLMLLKNPANDKMMLPSKMIQLAEIHLK